MRLIVTYDGQTQVVEEDQPKGYLRALKLDHPEAQAATYLGQHKGQTIGIDVDTGQTVRIQLEATTLS